MAGALFLLLLFVLPVLYFVLYRLFYQPYQLFKDHGIRGPKPIPFFGNYFMIRKFGLIDYPAELIKRYGAVSGFYVGKVPIMIIADVDMVKEILIRLNDQFPDRITVPDFLFKSVGLPPGLVTARGDWWRQSRQSIVSAFSPVNMRMIATCIESTCYKIGSELGEYADTGKTVRVDKLFGQYTMDATLALVFGETVDLDRKEREKFLTASALLFTTVDETQYLLLLVALSHFPWLESLLGMVMKKTWRGRYFKDICDTCMKLVLAHKSKNRLKNKNVLQLMLTANIKEQNGRTRKLTMKEIVSHAITFLMAGYETTKSALSCTAYLLALHPAVQEKLRKDIEDYFKINPDASLFDATQEVEYIEMVVQESLRIHPSTSSLSRLCPKTTTINGVTLPEGALLYIPELQLHQSEAHWPDPDRFDPERFRSEKKAKRPIACHVPFGLGPRNCIGFRFALLDIKMMLVHFLRKYKFEVAPETAVPLQKTFRITVAPKDGVHLKIGKW